MWPSSNQTGVTAKRASIIGACGLALGLLFGSAVAFLSSLGICRRENVTPPGAWPLVNDDPSMFFWVAAVGPAAAIVALALVGVERRTLVFSAAAALTFWVGYLVSLALT